MLSGRITLATPLALNIEEILNIPASASVKSTVNSLVPSIAPAPVNADPVLVLAIDVTDAGILMFLRFTQPSKAFTSIVVTPSNTIVSTPRQP